MVSVEDGSEIVTRLDGRPAADRGAKADRGHTPAVIAAPSKRYCWAFAIVGARYVRGINKLVTNRKSFTDVSWLIAKPTCWLAGAMCFP